MILDKKEKLRDIFRGFLFGDGKHSPLNSYYRNWTDEGITSKWSELDSLYSEGNDPMAVIIGAMYDEGQADIAWTCPLIIKKFMGGKPLTVNNILEAEDSCFPRYGWGGGINADNIKETARKIKKNFNSDVFNLFQTESAKEIIKNLGSLNQMGKKKRRMLTRDFAIAVNYEKDLPEPFWTDPIKKEWSDFGFDQLKNISDINIPTDSLVRRTTKRIIGNEDITDADIDKFGSEVYPKFPGLVDKLMWNVGRNFCEENNPKCRSCFLKEVCNYPESK